MDGCHKLNAFDVSQCKNLAKWLENGAMQRFENRVRFKTVAANARKAR